MLPAAHPSRHQKQPHYPRLTSLLTVLRHTFHEFKALYYLLLFVVCICVPVVVLLMIRSVSWNLDAEKATARRMLDDIQFALIERISTTNDVKQQSSSIGESILRRELWKQGQGGHDVYSAVIQQLEQQQSQTSQQQQPPLLTVIVPVRTWDLLDKKSLISIAQQFKSSSSRVEIIFAFSAQDHQYKTPKDELGLRRFEIYQKRFEHVMNTLQQVQQKMSALHKAKPPLIPPSVTMRVVPAMDVTNHRWATQWELERVLHRFWRDSICHDEYNNLYRIYNAASHYATGKFLMFLPSVGQIEALHVRMDILNRLLTTTNPSSAAADGGSGEQQPEDMLVGGTIITRVPDLVAHNARAVSDQWLTQQYNTDQDLCAERELTILASGFSFDRFNSTDYSAHARLQGHCISNAWLSSSSDDDSAKDSVVRGQLKRVHALPAETMIVSRQRFIHVLRGFSSRYMDYYCRQEADMTLLAAFDMSLRARNDHGMKVVVSNAVSVMLDIESQQSLTTVVEDVKLRNVTLDEQDGAISNTLHIAEIVYRRGKSRFLPYYSIDNMWKRFMKDNRKHVADLVDLDRRPSSAAEQLQLGSDTALFFKFPKHMDTARLAASMRLVEHFRSIHARVAVVRDGDKNSVLHSTHAMRQGLPRETVDTMMRIMIDEPQKLTPAAQCCILVQLATPEQFTSRDVPKTTSTGAFSTCHSVLIVTGALPVVGSASNKSPVSTGTTVSIDWMSYVAQFTEIWTNDPAHEQWFKRATAQITESTKKPLVRPFAPFTDTSILGPKTVPLARMKHFTRVEQLDDKTSASTGTAVSTTAKTTSAIFGNACSNPNAVRIAMRVDRPSQQDGALPHTLQSLLVPHQQNEHNAGSSTRPPALCLTIQLFDKLDRAPVEQIVKQATKDSGDKQDNLGIEVVVYDNTRCQSQLRGSHIVLIVGRDGYSNLDTDITASILMEKPLVLASELVDRSSLVAHFAKLALSNGASDKQSSSAGLIHLVGTAAAAPRKGSTRVTVREALMNVVQDMSAAHRKAKQLRSAVQRNFSLDGAVVPQMIRVLKEEMNQRRCAK